jgi:large subunit ribosomal protein L21
VTSYAVIQTGGKQYQVKSGDVLDVEKLEAEVGTRIELTDVRLVAEDSGVSVGTPTVDGALVTAEIEDQFRGPKIIIFKYKNKTHYRKKNGHRQSYTRIRIQDILTGGATPPPFVPKVKPEVVAEAPEVEAPVAEEKPAPRRRTRAAAATATTEVTAETTTEEKPAPARRTRAKAAEATTATETSTDEKPAPKRRTRAAAKKDTPETTPEAETPAEESSEETPK